MRAGKFHSAHASTDGNMSDFHTGLEQFEVPDTILVLDTETTGLNGAKYKCDPFIDPFFKKSSIDFNDDDRIDSLNWSRYGDIVVDIGICEVSLSKKTVKPVYSSIVGYNTDTWTNDMKSSWIFENTDLTVEEVGSAKPISQVKREVSALIKDKWLTTYNVQYDLDKFLYKFPWNLKGSFNECRDIMFSAKYVCKLKSQYYGISDYRYPKLDYAYAHILHGEDPAGIHGVQDHRALSDAKVASYVMIELFNNGEYDPLDFRGRHSSR